MDGEGQNWIVNATAQQKPSTMIDILVAHLEYLKAQR